jgi:thioredoxin 1
MKSTTFRFVTVLIIIAVLIDCAGTSMAPPARVSELPQDEILLDKTNFSKMIAVPGRVSMVDFFSPTCPPCRIMGSVVKKLSIRFRGKALIGKVNVETDDSLKLIYPAIPTPAFIFFSEGAVAGIMRGVFKEDSLAGVIDSLLAPRPQ